METLIFLCTFGTVCLFTVGLMMKGEAAVVRERMATLKILVEQDLETVVPELSNSFAERVVKPWLARVAKLFSRLLPSTALANAGAKLDHAGVPWNLKPIEWVGVKSLVLLLFVGIALLCAILLHMLLIWKLVLLGIGILIGYILPDGVLDHIIGERRIRVRRSLADILDLLVVCTEAGLGFEAALTKAAERMQGPLPQEFRRVLQDTLVGKTRSEALKSMAQRIDIPEVTTFVAAIHQSDALGVSIAQVLRVQADTLRIHRTLKAREVAAKLPVKMLFPLVLFIFPSIFTVLLAPSAISIYRALTGQ